MEMCKSQSWDGVLRQSLALLSQCPQRVHTAIGMGEAFRQEVQSKKSIAGQMLSHRHAEAIREVLVAVATGTSCSALDALARSHAEVGLELAANELNHTQNKLRLDGLIDTLRTPLGPEFLKRLRNGAITRALRLETIKEAAPFLVKEFLDEVGLEPDKIGDFLLSKPLILRQVYGKLWLCLNWLKKVDSLRFVLKT